MGITNGSFDITSNLPNVVQKISKIHDNLPEVYEHTVTDMKSRLPGKVASAVTWMYGIKKSEIRYNFKKEMTSTSVGSVSLRGENLESMSLIYRGRRLTPLHFSMRPKEPPKLTDEELKRRRELRAKGQKTKRKRYKVSAKIKSRRKNFPFREPKSVNGALFLMPVKHGADKYVPVWRLTNDKTPVKSVKTLSLPQMITNKMVARRIQKEKDELLEKRFDHHMARFIKKTF